MSAKPTQPVRILAHVRWLQFPYVGRALFFAESNGRLGFVPATETDIVAEQFFGIDCPDGITRALEAHVREPETKRESREK